MMSSTHYSPHLPRVPRNPSPVLESEEEGYEPSYDVGEDSYEENEYSPIGGPQNGDAFLVNDVYHQPMPLSSKLAFTLFSLDSINMNTVRQ